MEGNPLIRKESGEGEGDGDGNGETKEEGEISSGEGRVEIKIIQPPKNARVVSPVPRVTGGALSCLLAVDNVIRATAEFQSPRKFSFAPVSSRETSVAIEEEENDMLIPLQNTRHLFVREYNKPWQWPLEATSKFQILNTSGECIYYAAERSCFLSRCLFLRGLFPFQITLLSLDGEKVMEIQGQPFFQNVVTVKDSKGQLVGRIRKGRCKLRNCCGLAYSVRTWDGNKILNIVGPEGSNCWPFGECGDESDFEINLGGGRTTIGKIGAEWEYAVEELTGVVVPMKLDEMTMSLLLGAVFLIDFGYYQKKRDATCFGRCFLTFMSLGLFILLLFLIAKK